jgi:hypothetical protein
MSERRKLVFLCLAAAFGFAGAAHVSRVSENWLAVWFAVGACAMEMVLALASLVIMGDKPAKRSPYAECIIRIKAEVNASVVRSALQSVVHYVQSEAAPDWSFTGCTMREGLWTAEGEWLA